MSLNKFFFKKTYNLKIIVRDIIARILFKNIYTCVSSPQFVAPDVVSVNTSVLESMMNDD
jgi:hypothetical protein